MRRHQIWCFLLQFETKENINPIQYISQIQLSENRIKNFFLLKKIKFLTKKKGPTIETIIYLELNKNREIRVDTQTSLVHLPEYFLWDEKGFLYNPTLLF